MNSVYFNTLSNEIERTIDQSIKSDSFAHILAVFFFLSITITANPRFSDDFIFFETFCKVFDDGIILKICMLLYA